MNENESPLNNKNKSQKNVSNKNKKERNISELSENLGDDIASQIPDDISEDDELYKQMLKNSSLLYQNENENEEADTHTFHKKNKDDINDNKTEYLEIENKYKSDSSIIHDYEDYINENEEKALDSNKDMKDQLELNLYSLSSTENKDLSAKNLDQDFLYDINSELDKEKSVSSDYSAELKRQIKANFKFIKHEEEIVDDKNDVDEKNNLKVKQGFSIGTLFSWLILIIVLFLAYYWFQININKSQLLLKSKIVLLDSIRNTSEEVSFQPQLSSGYEKTENFVSHEVDLGEDSNIKNLNDSNKSVLKDSSLDKDGKINTNTINEINSKNNFDLESSIDNIEYPISVRLQKSQTLMDLALKYYKDKIFWVYIYIDNSSAIENPNKVYLGTKLKIFNPSKHGINCKDSVSINNAQLLQRALFNIKKK